MDKSMEERLARAEENLARVTRAMSTAANAAATASGLAGPSNAPTGSNQTGLLDSIEEEPLNPKRTKAGAQTTGGASLALPTDRPGGSAEEDEENLDGVAILELDLRSETEDSTWQPNDQVNKGKEKREDSPSEEEESMKDDDMNLCKSLT
ncbi:uncharacterized protein MELLADRAFT_66527 [Melampsora larici-populina 98AG31]|uniref:Uncharacterized protein n=1 Tax=Melampsora larici-populina (strain 98AG31 / pathotype 3-4-7) TaxID=747676 RepID=F4RZK9_MELLP|nr:uncharacterized protein MELLADRAFT_66527 [Melampsora larici-populina 98AG31]EGG02171.1 hypothetical protein MELLADRAFT_66527 [Melampsora larici-populina 98AG31]